MCEHVFVRWDNLRIDADEDGARLPGYRDPAVVRRFDAPEALDMRFYEVRAKSALNRVPAASRMPFRWTINPYRGCAHACLYCAWGETPILMADGRTRALAKLAVGDEIYGTVMRGRYRRYAKTQVLAHWSTVKPAYRVQLGDGTELIASGDHRFLTEGRGWKHVTGAQQGAARRPHLTLGNSLMGTGQFTETPKRSDDYERGYLCGMIRGDGHIGDYSYARPGLRPTRVCSFRLALADWEGLVRTEDYLLGYGVYTNARVFQAATATHRRVLAIGTSRRRSVERVRELTVWPLSPTDEWRRGFLAGIFDAEGHRGGSAIRITNGDPVILGWTESSLRHFRFDTVIERAGANGVRNVRILGGLQEHLRFFHLTDPAITRKRSMEGIAIKTASDLDVMSIEPLGHAMRLYDITTGTGDFIANGVVSHNCFARPTHTYLDFDADRDFDREIVVKVNVPEVVRAELARPSWKGEHVAMGTNTDPYQWVESRYKLMPGIWEAMRDARNPCSILTKSPLLLRDLPLMQEIAAVTQISANLSIPTLDAKAWRATEPHTPHPRARLEAVAELNRAGIPTGVLVAPLMPGINDAPEQVEPLLEAIAEAGATGVGGIALHLRGEVRQIFFDWLRAHRPDLLERYEELYARGAYAPHAERRRLAALLSHNALPPPSRFRIPDPRPERDADGPAGEPGRQPDAVQRTLF